jgi:hypothetical protein
MMVRNCGEKVNYGIMAMARSNGLEVREEIERDA